MNKFFVVLVLLASLFITSVQAYTAISVSVITDTNANLVGKSTNLFSANNILLTQALNSVGYSSTNSLAPADNTISVITNSQNNWSVRVNPQALGSVMYTNNNVKVYQDPAGSWIITNMTTGANSSMGANGHFSHTDTNGNSFTFNSAGQVLWNGNPVLTNVLGSSITGIIPNSVITASGLATNGSVFANNIDTSQFTNYNINLQAMVNALPRNTNFGIVGGGGIVLGKGIYYTSAGVTNYSQGNCQTRIKGQGIFNTFLVFTNAGDGITINGGLYQNHLQIDDMTISSEVDSTNFLVSINNQGITTFNNVCFSYWPHLAGNIYGGALLLAGVNVAGVEGAIDSFNGCYFASLSTGVLLADDHARFNNCFFSGIGTVQDLQYFYGAFGGALPPDQRVAFQAVTNWVKAGFPDLNLRACITVTQGYDDDEFQGCYFAFDHAMIALDRSPITNPYMGHESFNGGHFEDCGYRAIVASNTPSSAGNYSGGTIQFYNLDNFNPQSGFANAVDEVVNWNTITNVATNTLNFYQGSAPNVFTFQSPDNQNFQYSVGNALNLNLSAAGATLYGISTLAPDGHTNASFNNVTNIFNSLLSIGNAASSTTVIGSQSNLIANSLQLPPPTNSISTLYILSAGFTNFVGTYVTNGNGTLPFLVTAWWTNTINTNLWIAYATGNYVIASNGLANFYYTGGSSSPLGTYVTNALYAGLGIGAPAVVANYPGYLNGALLTNIPVANVVGAITQAQANLAATNAAQAATNALAAAMLPSGIVFTNASVITVNGMTNALTVTGNQFTITIGTSNQFTALNAATLASALQSTPTTTSTLYVLSAGITNYIGTYVTNGSGTLPFLVTAWWTNTVNTNLFIGLSTGNYVIVSNSLFTFVPYSGGNPSAGYPVGTYSTNSSSVGLGTGAPAIVTTLPAYQNGASFTNIQTSGLVGPLVATDISTATNAYFQLLTATTNIQASGTANFVLTNSPYTFTVTGTPTRPGYYRVNGVFEIYQTNAQAAICSLSLTNIGSDSWHGYWQIQPTSINSVQGVVGSPFNFNYATYGNSPLYYGFANISVATNNLTSFQLTVSTTQTNTYNWGFYRQAGINYWLTTNSFVTVERLPK